MWHRVLFIFRRNYLHLFHFRKRKKIFVPVKAVGRMKEKCRGQNDERGVERGWREFIYIFVKF